MIVTRVIVTLLISWATMMAQVPEEGAVAPTGCWPQRGGSAAHTAESLTPVTRTRPEVAWRHRADGRLEGEPRVWRSRVFVTAATKRVGRRTLSVLDLRTGQPLVRSQEFKTDFPLSPSVSASYVAVRSGDDAFEVFSLGRTQLRSEYREVFKKVAVGPPLLHGRHLYVRVGDSLRCFDVQAERELWSTSGEYRGLPALRGDHLFAIKVASGGTRWLVQLDRATGAALVSQKVGEFPGVGRAERLDDVEIAVLPGGAAVIHERPIPGLVTPDVRWFTVAFQGEGAARRLTVGGPAPFAGTPAAHSRSWFGRALAAAGMNPSEPRRDTLFKAPSFAANQVQLLAASAIHAAYADVEAPVVASGVVLLGLRAVDTESLRVLWELEGTGSRRVVPAQETLLVSLDDELRAYRARLPDRAKAMTFGEELAAAPGRLLLDDGRVVDGTLTKRGDAFVLAAAGPRGKEQSFSLAEVVLATTANRVAYCRDPSRLPLALRALAQDDEARARLELAARACDGRDAEQIGRLLAAAQEVSPDDETIERIVKRLRYIRTRKDPVRGDVVEEVARGEEKLRSDLAEASWTRLGSVADAPRPLRLDLWREHARAFPADTRVAAAVRALVPEGVRVPERMDVADWLDFVEALGQTTIRRVAPPTPGQRGLTHEQLQLGSARATWRNDLEGIASDTLLVLTPLSAPGSLARALSVGELVCATLSNIFLTGEAARDERFKLLIQLYENKDEYLAESAKLGGRVHPGLARQLEYTLGHYAPRDNLSRIYIRADAPGVQGIMDTYVHELTHHWLEQRCPLFRVADMRSNPMTPGCAIVEGFATMIEEFRFDTRTQSHESLDPRCMSLDVVSHATQLLPWDAVIFLNQVQFQSLRKEPGPPVPTRWNLGMARELSVANLFYAQSAALCHYLYEADGTRRRADLLEFVRLHYTGQATLKNIRELLGDPADVGKRVEAWAREVSAAER